MNNKLIVFAFLLSSAANAEQKALPPVIDQSTYYSGVNRTVAPSNNAIYEVLGRLEQLQLEVQQLRGVVEEQAYLIEQLKSRQSTIYTDLDQRLLDLTGGALPVAVQPVAEGADNVVPEAATESHPDNAVADTVAPEVNQKQVYQAAYETLRNGHNNQAITAFNQLLKQFPQGEYADNAWYWLGEAYKVKQDVKAAKHAFEQVVKLFPNSPKVPDALLKLGYIELDQDNKIKARDYFTRVTINYPTTTAAHLATKKLLQMDRR